MAVCFDPVLGEMRLRDEPNGPPLSFKLDGAPLSPDANGVVDIPSATTARKGIVKLNTSTNSTSQTEAATPSAVRSAYQLANTANNSSAKTGSDNSFYGENWFERKTGFSGEVEFRTPPRSRSDGKCCLTLFNNNGEVVGDLSTFLSAYDPSSGETVYYNEAFSDFAVATILRANGYAAGDMWANFDPWSGDGNAVYASPYFGGPERSWPFYTYAHDDETGETTQHFWKNLHITYAGGAWQYSADETVDGEPGWRRYWFDLMLADSETDSEVGSVCAWVSWKVRPGRGVDVRFESSSDFYLFDQELGENVYASPDGDYPWVAYGSSIPDSPYYDPQYEGAEYMGWSPADNSSLATEASVEGTARATATDLIEAHNALSTAHPYISLNASRITSGTLNAARIPGLDASKITSGLIANDRLHYNVARGNYVPGVNDSRDGIYLYLDGRGVPQSSVRYGNREGQTDNGTIYMLFLSKSDVPTNQFETWIFYTRRLHNARPFTISLLETFNDGQGKAETFGCKWLVRMDSSCEGILTYSESEKKFSVAVPSGDVFRSPDVYAHRWVALHIVGCTCSTCHSPGVSWSPGNCGTFIIVTAYAAAQI